MYQADELSRMAMDLVNFECSERDELYQTISDASKDATGVRVRLDIDQYSTEQLRELAEYWCSAAEKAVKLEQEDEKNRLAEWNKRLAAYSRDFSISRETAIRWDMEAEGTDDFDQYCWRLGIGFQHKEQGFCRE